MQLELLASGARELGIDLRAAHGAALLDLVSLLEAGNARFNLTAIRDRLGMLQKHVLDSLSLHRIRGHKLVIVCPKPQP